MTQGPATLTVAIAIGQLNQKAGPSVNGVRLARALRERGCRVFLVHRTPDDAADQQLADEFRGDLMALPWVHPFDPRYVLAFSRHLRRHRPDIVHFNLQRDPLMLAPPARLHGSRVVYTMRNLVEYNASWLQRGLKMIGPRFIDRFVGVSQAIADNINQHHLTRAPTSVIYNGVEWADQSNIPARRNEVRRELGIGPNEIVVSTCGRLSPDKGQIHLLEAARLLDGSQFRLVIVGDGNAREQMEDFCEAHDLTNVIFAGWQADVNRFLAASDIFIFHSMPQSEGLPTVVTEAAMMGLPLVLADIACLREVYTPERQALFATPGQPEEFAEQLTMVINSSSLREKLALEAREVAIEHFSIDTMADRYLALYEELTG